MPEAVTRVPLKQCPECGKTFDALVTREDSRGPQTGDPIACLGCGAVMTIERGEVRGFTEAEMADLMADRETMNELARVVERIHLLKHMQN